MTATPTHQASELEAKKQLFDMMLAFVKSQCLYVAARLGIYNLLSDQGEQSLSTIAKTTQTDPERLYFVLRALAHVGVLEEKPDRVFAPTVMSNLMVTNRGASIGHLAMHLLEPAQWNAWNMLEESLHTGEVPFERANGQGVYEFCQGDDWSGDVFIKAMSFFTAHSIEALLDAYDFSRFKTVMDVGGGQGGLIAGIVKRFGCKGILFDVPYVAATAPAYLEQQGVEAGAIDIITGDVFVEIPTGADAIVMKYFISAWNDEDAAKILHNCKKALPPHGRIVLLQAFVPDLDEPKTAPDGIMPGIFAVQINVAVPGGGWRTKKQFQSLFEQCGFRLEQVVDTTTNLSAMEFSIAG
ncbi:methyltransferase [Leptolyngbya sp. NIES-2104]|uniref:methyltransferase n=1 Tax=Leptolyngbya sp. NIES-2104 TaxID=1552121 RepID=UPI0006EC6E2D|nr:methyltransferase [Leptolyngbya sp. NIES-2104]GAP97175.1 O-methyltransferase [Leptolyngbya sp. NIES-2104]